MVSRCLPDVILSEEGLKHANNDRYDTFSRSLPDVILSEEGLKLAIAIYVLHNSNLLPDVILSEEGLKQDGSGLPNYLQPHFLT